MTEQATVHTNPEYEKASFNHTLPITDAESIIDLKNTSALTETELAALDALVTTANLIYEITYSEANPHDWNEACALIHNLQHMIMSQAAGRAYPELFRLLGQDSPRNTPLKNL